MPKRNGAVARGPALPAARRLPVRSPRCPADTAHLSDGGIPATLTRRPPDTGLLVGPVGAARDSAGAGELQAPIPPPDR